MIKSYKTKVSYWFSKLSKEEYNAEVRIVRFFKLKVLITTFVHFEDRLNIDFENLPQL